MTSKLETPSSRHRPAKGLGMFEKYLTLWVALCIVAGIVLGKIAPGVARFLDGLAIHVGDAPVVSEWVGLGRAGVGERDEELHFETAVLPAGTYSFTMSGTGDADLYVRVGLAPTVADYDCRPHRAGSNEACKVVLPAPARLFGMVRGYSESSTFDLAGAAER